MKVTLAKALKTRKLLVECLSKITGEITSYNCTSATRVKGADGSVIQEASFKDEVDVRKLLEQKTEVTNLLIEVKKAILSANVEQNDNLLRMAEVKGNLSFFNTLQCEDGESSRFSNQTGNNISITVYKSEIRKKERDDTVSSLKKELSRLQEEIEKFNWTKEVVIPDSVSNYI